MSGLGILVAVLTGLATFVGMCWLGLDAVAYRSLRRAIARGDLIDEPGPEVHRFSGNGFGQNPDIDYRYCLYRIPPGRAALLRGRVHPDAVYTSVVVYDALLQSVLPELTTGPTIRNHEQLELGPGGSFTIVLAATDPGHPNWLDTSAVPEGIVFERHIGAAPDDVTSIEIVDLDEVQELSAS